MLSEKNLKLYINVYLQYIFVLYSIKSQEPAILQREPQLFTQSNHLALISAVHIMRFIYEMSAKVGTCYFILFNRYFAQETQWTDISTVSRTNHLCLNVERLVTVSQIFSFQIKRQAFSWKNSFRTLFVFIGKDSGAREEVLSKESYWLVLQTVCLGFRLATYCSLHQQPCFPESMTLQASLALKRKEVDTCMQTSAPIIPQYEAGGLVQRRQA